MKVRRAAFGFACGREVEENALKSGFFVFIHEAKVGFLCTFMMAIALVQKYTRVCRVHPQRILLLMIPLKSPEIASAVRGIRVSGRCV